MRGKKECKLCTLWFMVSALNPRTCHALCPLLYLESAEDGGHSAVQGVPAPVAFVNHGFELAGSVSAVLSGQAAVLVIDQFQLGQPLMNLPLETLKRAGEDGMNLVKHKIIKKAILLQIL